MAEQQRPSEQFTSIDAAWLRMDQPTNLMIIVGVLMFDEPIDFGQLQRIVEERMLSFRRFRQRVSYPQGPMGPAFWEDDPYFDIRSHLRKIALPAPGDQAALQTLVGDYMSTPLDPSKPLWQMHLIEGYGGGCAVLARIHHCIADGIALIRVLLSMTDSTPEATEPVRVRKNGAKNPLAAMIKPAVRAFTGAGQAAAEMWAESSEIARDPLRLIDMIQSGADSAAAMARLLALPPDPQTLLKGRLGVHKLAVWSDPLDLEAVKAIGKVTACTVNDVLLSCVTGGLRRYLLARGAAIPPELSIRAAVPVNMRSLEAPIELGNRFSLIFLELPLGVAGALDRLIALKENMDAIKGSAEAIVGYGILSAIGALPEQIERAVINIFGSKATGVMTNVPGPRQPIYMAGREVADIMFWVPQSGYLGLGVSILSYAGKVRVGLAVDAGLIPDPQPVLAAFQADFNELNAMMERAREVQAQVMTLSSGDGAR